MSPTATAASGAAVRYYFRIIAGIMWVRYYNTFEEARTYRSAVVDAMAANRD